jgi:hypothetical protein
MSFPAVSDSSLVGTYDTTAYAGGGYVWDAVLEYRVWCYIRDGADNLCDGSDYYYSFSTYEDAHHFSSCTEGAQLPLALVLQEEYIDEPEDGHYIHVKQRRITEWPVELLKRPRRAENTIPDFLSPNAPANRLDILRGLSAKGS